MRLKFSIYSVIFLILLLILNVTFTHYEFSKTTFIIFWILLFYAFVFQHLHKNKLEPIGVVSATLLYSVFNFLLFPPAFTVLTAMAGTLPDTFGRVLTASYIVLAKKMPLQIIVTALLVSGIYFVHTRLDRRRRKKRKTKIGL